MDLLVSRTVYLEGEQYEQEQKRVRSVITYVLVALAMTSGLSLLNSLWFRYSFEVVLFSLGPLLLYIALWQLTVRGYYRWAGVGLTFVLWALMSLAIFRFGGVRSQVMPSYLIVIVVSGLVCTQRANFVFILLTIVSTGVFFCLDRLGLVTIDVGATSSSWNYLLTNVTNIIAVALLIYVANWETYKALFYAWEAIRRQRKAEAVLQAQQDNLEQLVAERTAKLSVANQNLEAFATTISHDLKAPLMAVNQLTQATTIESDYLSQEDIRLYTQMVQEQMERMQTLIDGVLAYSQASYAEDKEQVRLDEVIHSVYDYLPLSDHVEVEIELGKDDMYLCTERLKLVQVLTNLIGNGIRYHRPEGGWVRVRVMEESVNWLRFEVADNGLGIPPEEINGLFDMFFMGIHKRHDSTGIGLALVKRLVNEQGGEVGVKSRVGKGSTFWFTWPAGIEEGEEECVY